VAAAADEHVPLLGVKAPAVEAGDALVVVDVAGVDVVGIAESPVGAPLLDLLEECVEAGDVGGHGLGAGLAPRVNHYLALLDRAAHGLLDHDVLVVVECAQSLLDVQVIRCGD